MYNAFDFKHALNIEKLFGVDDNIIKVVVFMRSTNESKNNYGVAQKKLFDNGLYTDMVIRTNEKDFPCHKIILAARSDYFKTLFESNFQDTNILDWSDVFDSGTVETILEYFYNNGQIPIDIEEKSYDLLKVAHLRVLKRLKNACFDSLRSNITVENAIKSLEIAKEYGEKELIEECIDFVGDHCEKVMETGAYQNMNPATKLQVFDHFVRVLSKKRKHE